MARSPPSSCRGQQSASVGFDQGPAKLRLAVAAILHQEGQKLARAFKIDGIDDRAAVFARGQRASARERAAIWNDRVLCGSSSARAMSPAAMPSRPAANEQAEDLEAALLRQRAEGADGVRCFHVSRHMETMRGSQRGFCRCDRATRQARRKAVWQAEMRRIRRLASRRHRSMKAAGEASEPIRLSPSRSIVRRPEEEDLTSVKTWSTLLLLAASIACRAVHRFG